MKYEESLRQLDDIVRKMENNEFDIDQLSEQLKKAKKLISQCKDKLQKTNEEIQKILDDEQ
ncbi:MAG: exodeoxyribonuclease VII small subunit [Prevotella sp.]|nr:exodeoxyribonuclease VII small subunit [Prevotella sp.]